MKTFALLFALLLVMIASPAIAAKHEPCPGVNVGTQSRGHADRTRAYRPSAGKSAHARRKVNKRFETPKNQLHLSGRNPNKGHRRDHSEGGFYSFRRHSYTAHIFNR